MSVPFDPERLKDPEYLDHRNEPAHLYHVLAGLRTSGPHLRRMLEIFRDRVQKEEIDQRHGAVIYHLADLLIRMETMETYFANLADLAIERRQRELGAIMEEPYTTEQRLKETTDELAVLKEVRELLGRE